MSNAPEPELDLDLQFLPAWAQQSPSVNRYADFEGETESRFDRRRPDREGRGRRDRGPRRGPPGDTQRGPGGPPTGRQRPPGGPSRRPDRYREQERREPAIVLPEIEVNILPEEKGVEGLVRQIRAFGRAYPLFDIGFLILKQPERYNVRFSVVKKADGQVAQPLFLCAIDETLWLSESEAAEHVLNRHFSTFYQGERIAAEPPKGVFTFVAQCGLSGTVLGPPNYHDYQNKLRKLHAERYSHMAFEVYKSRVKIVRDEAVVKKWIEDQSYTLEYVCLNVTEPLKLSNRQEVERHFRETHLAHVIQPVESCTLSGTAARSLPCVPLQMLARRVYEEQRRFPLKMVTVLSQMFASQGLQFFKVNKTLTHVAVSRPHYLDLSVTPVSEGIKRIIGFINEHPGTNRRKLLEALGPAPPTPEGAGAQAPAPPPGEVVATPGPAAEGEGSPAPAPPQASSEATPQTPEMSAVISDLHWLIHQGHVIEFANGNLETAKMPPPRPPKLPRPQAEPDKAGTVPEKGAAPIAATGTEETPTPGGETADLATPTEPTLAAAAAPEGDVPVPAPNPAQAELLRPQEAPSVESEPRPELLAANEIPLATAASPGLPEVHPSVE